MNEKKRGRYLRRLLAMCVGISMLGSAVTVSAVTNPDGSVLINEENFPDQNLRNYLMNSYYVQDHVNGDLYTQPYTVLEKNELDAVRSLEVGFQRDGEVWTYENGQMGSWEHGSYDLRGIENFSNLEMISIGEVSNLIGSIPALPKLNTVNIEEDLSCYKLNFSVLKQKLPLAQIRNFSISHPTLGTVDLSALEKMESFSMKLPMAHNGDTLYYDRCIYRGALDFRKNKGIKEIHIENANLTKLNVSANTELNRLELIRTNVKNLDLSKNKKLKELYIGGGSGVTFRLPAKNRLEKIRVNMIGGSLDLTSCTASLKEIENSDEKGVIKVCMKRSVLKELLKKKGLKIHGNKLKKSQVKFPKKGKYAYFEM